MSSFSPKGDAALNCTCRALLRVPLLFIPVQQPDPSTLGKDGTSGMPRIPAWLLT